MTPHLIGLDATGSVRDIAPLWLHLVPVFLSTGGEFGPASRASTTRLSQTVLLGHLPREGSLPLCPVG
jgi:hypothetical protein